MTRNHEPENDEAEDALGRLREVEETDPNEEVRHAASVAIGEIESR